MNNFRERDQLEWDPFSKTNKMIMEKAGSSRERGKGWNYSFRNYQENVIELMGIFCGIASVSFFFFFGIVCLSAHQRQHERMTKNAQFLWMQIVMDFDDILIKKNVLNSDCECSSVGINILERKNVLKLKMWFFVTRLTFSCAYNPKN